MSEAVAVQTNGFGPALAQQDACLMNASGMQPAKVSHPIEPGGQEMLEHFADKADRIKRHALAQAGAAFGMAERARCAASAAGAEVSLFLPNARRGSWWNRCGCRAANLGRAFSGA
jgi:hypothetical protein